MNDRYKLQQDRSETIPFFRWLGFVLAIVVGFTLGWQFFRSPQPFPNPDPIPTSTDEPIPSTPESNVIIPVAGTLSSRLGQTIRVGSLAPDFTLLNLQGTPLSLNMFRGSVVLINFWTTWCPPCRLEMPALQLAYEKYRDQGFTVLGVNWTRVDDLELVEPFTHELGLTFPIVLDASGEVSEDLYNIIGLPTSIFVGRDGTVREIFIGPLLIETLETKIQTLLEEST